MNQCTFCKRVGAKVKCKGGCLAKYCNERCARAHGEYGHNLSVADHPWSPRTPCEELKRLQAELNDIRERAWSEEESGITSADEDREDDIMEQQQEVAIVGSLENAWPCANPKCQKRGKKKCSKCKGVKYCSRNCQVAHWRSGHKHECEGLQQIKASLLAEAQAEVDEAWRNSLPGLAKDDDNNMASAERKAALGKRGVKLRRERARARELDDIKALIKEVEGEAKKKPQGGGRKRRKTQRRRRRTRRKRRRTRRRRRRTRRRRRRK